MKLINTIFVSGLFFLVIIAAKAGESFRYRLYIVEIADNQETVLAPESV